ncbi:sugar ABC transporter ATP-binding protein [Alkaliphilus crotonatoxidans]
MQDNVFVKLSNVSKTFPGVKALDNVSLELRKGEVHALVGENGAGKSTLIKVLAGVHFPDEGANMIIDGEKTAIKNPMDAMEKGISVIYQDISLFPNLSVAENIAIGNKRIWGKRLKWNEIKEVAKKAIEKVGAKIDTNKRLGDLSIASQQIVAIARAITFNAKLVIMDEPTSSLSKAEILQLYKIIENMKKEGIAVLFISHKFDEIYTVADRVTVFRDGRYIDSKPISEISEPKLIKLMVGRDVQYLSLKGDKIEDEEIFKVKGLTKKGNFKDITFNLKKGEILGITGLVGSGRSELAKAIFGIYSVDSGTMELKGKRLEIKDSKDALEEGIGYVPENRHLEGLVLEEPIYKNMILAVMDRLTNKKGMLKNEEIINITKEQIKSLDVRPADETMKVGQLSGGNQQKVVLGKWIVSNPKLLIVDEPTNGVDIGAKIEIHKVLRNLTNQGIGVIVISSELPEVLALSDRIMVMRRGVVGGFVDNNNISQEDIMSIALGTESNGEKGEIKSEENSPF